MKGTMIKNSGSQTKISFKPSLDAGAYELKTCGWPYVPLTLAFKHSTPHFAHTVIYVFLYRRHGKKE